MTEDADRNNASLSIVVEFPDAAEEIVIDGHIGIDDEFRDRVAEHMAHDGNIRIRILKDYGRKLICQRISVLLFLWTTQGHSYYEPQKN